MAEKKKPSNKSEKKSTSTKKEAPKSIDWSAQPAEVIIIGKQSKHLEEGKEYKVVKSTAQALIEKGVATLK